MVMPTLIILPGWGGSHETWQPWIKKANENFDTHCIDLPCFGGVPCPPEVWGVDEYARYVERSIRELRLTEKPILLGHSFGGQVAVRLAASHPEYFRGLILSAAAVLRPSRPIRNAVFFAIAKSGKLLFRLPIIERGSVLAKKLLYCAARSPDYAKTSEIQREIFRKIIRQDLRHLLPDIVLPTLIVWGTRDTYLPVQDGKAIAELMPNACLRLIRGAGHGLHLRNTDEFLRELRSFAAAIP